MPSSVAPANRGPGAFLALFAPPSCRRLSHKPCGEHNCPCSGARAWLRSLPRSISFEEIWKRCDRPEWLRWLMDRYGLKAAGDCAAIRRALPWPVVAEALANPPPSATCDDCGKDVPIGELYDGRCEDCDGEYVYCQICPERVHRDSLCAHLRWSDAAGEEVGVGADEPEDHRESFDRMLGKLGLRHARTLRRALADGTWFRSYTHQALEEAVERLGDRARDTDDHTEVGLYWLETLSAGKDLRPHVKRTLGWIDAHLAARAKAIAADRRPRWVVRDGGRRYFVRGEWTAIPEQGAWMRHGKARRTARALRKAYPGAVVRAVHVLTPHVGGAR
jgi:hypothetical protein